MRSRLNDSDHLSEQEKNRQLEDNRAQAEKPKATDTRKRPGRPRKSIKSPKRGHRNSDESLKNSKSRSRTRTITTSANNNNNKKKQPISKATVATSDDSDSRSQVVSSDSESDRRAANVAATVPAIGGKRKSRLSVSSSDEESPPPNRKNNNNSVSEDDAARWRRVAIKRNKLSDSPKKQDKKKNSSKAKPRRPRSRVNHVTGDSDSEIDLEAAIRNNRIQVARSVIYHGIAASDDHFGLRCTTVCSGVGGGGGQAHKRRSCRCRASRSSACPSLHSRALWCQEAISLSSSSLIASTFSFVSIFLHSFYFCYKLVQTRYASQLLVANSVLTCK